MNAFAQQRRFAESRSDYFVFSPVRARSRAQTCELAPIPPSCISMEMKNTDPTRVFISGETELLTWLELAAPGARSIYHVGHLACDRSPDMSNMNAAARADLNSIAHRVMALVEQRAVIAVQQRLDDGQVAYLAIKARVRPSRSGAPRPHLPPAAPRHLPGITVLTDDITAAHIPNPSRSLASSANSSIAAPTVSQ